MHIFGIDALETLMHLFSLICTNIEALIYYIDT